MADHKPFSVAITVRAVCHDRDALMAAGRASLLRDGNSLDAVVDIMAGWDAADAVTELLHEGLARLPHSDATTPYPPAGDRGPVGFEVVEMENSYSGEGDYGDFDGEDQ